MNVSPRQPIEVDVSHQDSDFPCMQSNTIFLNPFYNYMLSGPFLKSFPGSIGPAVLLSFTCAKHLDLIGSQPKKIHSKN